MTRAGYELRVNISEIVITHPLHPHFRGTFPFEGWIVRPGRICVRYLLESEKHYSCYGVADVAWTQLRRVDAFEQASAGRSLFRVDDLLCLAGEVRSLRKEGVRMVGK